MGRQGLVILVVLAGGCIADLKRVHTPDLLNVTDKQARKWAGGTNFEPVESMVPARQNWQIHSSLKPIEALTDASTASFAQAPLPDSRDQFILIDLGEVVTIRQVIQAHPRVDGYPRRYRIDVAGDHNFPYSLRFVGRGSPGQSIAVFNRPVQCRFLRITLLETGPDAWNVGDLWVH